MKDFRTNAYPSALVEDSYIPRLVDLLRQYDPDEIILFGSRARGEDDDLSDYDIVVIKKTDRPFLDRMQDMVPFLVQFEKPADILVYTPEEFDQMGETGLGWMIRSEGVVLYERLTC